MPQEIDPSNSTPVPLESEEEDVKQKGVLAQRGYRQVSLPIPLVERVDKYIKTHKGEGFTAVPEFVRSAIRAKLERGGG